MDHWLEMVWVAFQMMCWKGYLDVTASDEELALVYPAFRRRYRRRGAFSTNLNETRWVFP